MPSVFISYTHADRLIARRVARRLSAYGIDAWLDERELRLGSALEPTIKGHIDACDVVVPIATEAAAQSAWVAKEISFATSRTPAKSVCPLLVEPVQTVGMFEAHLGLNATDAHTFESQLVTLAGAVLGDQPPEPNRERLLDDVRRAVIEEPGLSILVNACLDGPGLSDTNFEAVMGLSGHVLDYAINALYDGCDDASRTRVAWHAAYLFKQRGAGFYALDKYARLPKADRIALGIAVGTPLDPVHHGAALKILESCPEPHDSALASFIFHNKASLSTDNANTIVRLVCYPNRQARDSTVSAALQAITLRPTSGDLRRLWVRWITDGQFDGGDKDAVTRSQAIQDLGTVLSIQGETWDDLREAFRRRMRTLARTPDRESIQIALNYLMTAANEKSELTAEVLTELRAATGSAEWDGWPDREEMSIYVDEHLNAATSDLNWMGAIERFRTSWQTVKEFNAFLDRDK